MVEWFKAAVLKTAAGSACRGFKSHSLRQFFAFFTSNIQLDWKDWIKSCMSNCMTQDMSYGEAVAGA